MRLDLSWRDLSWRKLDKGVGPGRRIGKEAEAEEDGTAMAMGRGHRDVLNGVVRLPNPAGILRAFRLGSKL
jgi:hypothetical protein